MGGRQDTMRLETVAVQDAPEASAVAISLAARAFPPSAQELAAHAEFLLQIKNVLWKKVAAE